MENLLHDFRGIPLWGQIMLVVLVLVVGNFWLQRVSTGLIAHLKMPGGSFWQLIKLAVAAGLIAYMSVTYWIGSGAHGEAYPWGLWGRGAFIVVTIYLTVFFQKVFSR